MAISLTRRRLLVLLIAAGALLAWVLVDALWETDAEKIRAVLDRLAGAAAAGDAAAVMAEVGPEFSHEDLTRDDLAGLVGLYFTLYGPTSVTYLHRGEIMRSGNRAIIEVVVLTRSDPNRSSYAAGRSRWRLSLRAAAARWQIVRLEPLAFEGRQLGGWRDAARELR